MKYIIWLCLSILSFSAFGQQPATIEDYVRSAEALVIENLLAKRPELKDFEIVFIHEFEKTQDVKTHGDRKYTCDFSVLPTKQGRCTTITQYYFDYDCWACVDPFEGYHKETTVLPK